MSNQDRTPPQFGCQARPWLQTMGAETFVAQLPAVMQQIAGIGFTGFETAMACLPLNDPASFARAREEAGGLQLAAAHTGGAWWEPDKAASVPDLLDQIALLPGLGCHRVMVSIGKGVTEIDDHDLLQLVATLMTLGEGASQKGVELAIHNHAHELAADARVIRALVKGTEPHQLRLGTDLGWVVHGGWDPVLFLEEFGDRVSYLHVRDVQVAADRQTFVEVGRGTTDWPRITAALDRIGFAGWLVAESEFTDAWGGLLEPLETAEAQFQGMQAALAG